VPRTPICSPAAGRWAPCPPRAGKTSIISYGCCAGDMRALLEQRAELARDCAEDCAMAWHVARADDSLTSIARLGIFEGGPAPNKTRP